MAEFREAVDYIIDLRNQVLIKLLYLGAYRISEVLAHARRYETEHNQTKAYGKSLVWKTTDFKADDKTTVKTTSQIGSCKKNQDCCWKASVLLQDYSPSTFA